MKTYVDSRVGCSAVYEIAATDEQVSCIVSEEAIICFVIGRVKMDTESGIVLESCEHKKIVFALRVPKIEVAT